MRRVLTILFMILITISASFAEITKNHRRSTNTYEIFYSSMVNAEYVLYDYEYDSDTILNDIDILYDITNGDYKITKAYINNTGLYQDIIDMNRLMKQRHDPKSISNMNYWNNHKTICYATLLDKDGYYNVLNVFDTDGKCNTYIFTSKKIF